MRDSPASTVRTYVTIWIWLASLMFIGVLLSEMHVTKRTIVIVVLGLSSIKAILVGMYYMHLKTDQRLLTVILLAPVGILLLAFGLLWSSHFVRL